MTAEPLPEPVSQSLQRAQVMLADAQFLLEHGRHLSAADRAYYAMFHAAWAALLTEAAKMPKKHGGLKNQFGYVFVRTQRVDSALADYLSAAVDLRHDSTYGSDKPLSFAEVEDIVMKAARFVEAIAALLGNLNSGASRQSEE